MCCLSPSDETSAESSVGKLRDTTVSRIKVSLLRRQSGFEDCSSTVFCSALLCKTVQ